MNTYTIDHKHSTEVNAKVNCVHGQFMLYFPVVY